MTNKFSPKKYIIENGNKFPIYKCLVADDYDNLGLTSCLLIRKQPSGKFMFTTMLIDRYCLGVKDTFCNCNFDQNGLDEIMDRMNANGSLTEVDEVYFHNLVYAAIDFAIECGFNPVKEFSLSEKLLDDTLIDDGIDDIPVGENGVPLFVNGPYDDVNRVIATLNRKVGEGNYKVQLLG
ncbi:MAG: hypothetical protein OEX22_09320 [Cyclobacteriaceae bacterium]|nr:hypothetical protein [Cyclobacteriaceae bacterium]